MVIENRSLAEGTILSVTYKKAQHRCTVIKTDKGLEFRLADGKTFGSPSSAGKAITGRVSCDGWKFWSIAEAAMPAPAQSLTAEKPKREPKTGGPRMVRNIRKMPNQKGVAEGSTKWWCSACMKGFITESAELPQTCPENHPVEQADQFAVPGEAIDGEV